jgi:hypothetical protein
MRKSAVMSLRLRKLPVHPPRPQMSSRARRSHSTVASRSTEKRPVRSARAGNHRFRLLRALRAYTKAPYKTDLLWETLKGA